MSIWHEEYERISEICKNCNDKKKCRSLGSLYDRLSSGITCKKWTEK